MEQNTKYNTVCIVDKRIKRGASLIELVIMITVLSLVSTITLSMLFSISDTSIDVQSEAFSELKFKTLFQKMKNELIEAHPDFIQISEDKTSLHFKRYFIHGEAQIIANGYITDPSQPVFNEIKKGMRLTFFPFGYDHTVYHIASTNRKNNSIWANGVQDTFSKLYIVLHGEGHIYKDKDKIKFEQTGWGDGSAETYVLGDQSTSLAFAKISNGLLQIKIDLAIGSEHYSKTEFIVID